MQAFQATLPGVAVRADAEEGLAAKMRALFPPVNRIAAVPIDESAVARRDVESYCQSLVDIRVAQWWTNDDGDTELHLESGGEYLFGNAGIVRLK